MSAAKVAAMLGRVLEPEAMDCDDEALAYDAMDHAAVNDAFCDDALALGLDVGRVLDVGTGTARIPIGLCLRRSRARVTAIDVAAAMLRLAARNVEHAALSGAIALERLDARALPFDESAFTLVLSNSIVHHLPDPAPVLREMRRVLAPGGWLFVRDLARPADDGAVRALVAQHAAGATEPQRALFEASLRAAFTLDEVRAWSGKLGIPASATRLTSDRHWTLAYQNGTS